MGGLSIWHWIVVLVILLVFVLPWVLYIRSIQLTLMEIDPQYREMQPGSAWLLLIPLFNIVWLFIVVSRIRGSFKNLSEAGMLRHPTTAGSDVGLAMAICYALTLVPYLNILTGLAMVVLWIIHWVAVVNGRSEIMESYETAGGGRHLAKGSLA